MGGKNPCLNRNPYSLLSFIQANEELSLIQTAPLLTRDLDFLHNLWGSIVDFNTDSDWISMIIDLIRRTY